jgi:hypothetical protein
VPSLCDLEDLTLAEQLLFVRFVKGTNPMTKLPLALLAFTACVASDDSKIPETSDDVASALEKENGGLNMNDESTMFGTPDLFELAAIEPDAPEADAMRTEVDAMGTAPGVRVRDVVIVWGQIPADPNATGVRDWSGRLDLNRGGMMIRRRIAFEQATGDRILPRTDRTRIDFVSHTRPAADGLVLTVADPTPAAGPLTLTYTPADGSAARTIELRELADGPVVADLGDGNKIILSARDRDPCDNGFMRGRWHALGEHGGVFLGVVANADGDPIGHVRGLWGERQNGAQVFFAKYITAEGQFRGILAGTYADGHFDGRWLVRAGDHGQLHGVYFRHDNVRGGHFLARWGETSCRQN